jgi:hypothetical protein
MIGFKGRARPPKSEDTVTTDSKVAHIHKSIHCVELDWEGVESCDWYDCQWADICKAVVP